MARGIKLRRWAIAHANHYHLRGFRLRIDVEETCGGMDANVFLFRRRLPDPVTGVVYNEFMTVASFVDMSWYPVGAPDPDKNQPFFRASAVELDVKSAADYEGVWHVIRSEVERLAAAMDNAGTLVVQDVVWLGQAPAGAHISESLSDAPAGFASESDSRASLAHG